MKEDTCKELSGGLIFNQFPSNPDSNRINIFRESMNKFIYKEQTTQDTAKRQHNIAITV